MEKAATHHRALRVNQTKCVMMPWDKRIRGARQNKTSELQRRGSLVSLCGFVSVMPLLLNNGILFRIMIVTTNVPIHPSKSIRSELAKVLRSKIVSPTSNWDYLELDYFIRCSPVHVQGPLLGVQERP